MYFLGKLGLTPNYFPSQKQRLEANGELTQTLSTGILSLLRGLEAAEAAAAGPGGSLLLLPVRGEHDHLAVHPLQHGRGGSGPRDCRHRGQTGVMRAVPMLSLKTLPLGYRQHNTLRRLLFSSQKRTTLISSAEKPQITVVSVHLNPGKRKFSHDLRSHF